MKIDFEKVYFDDTENYLLFRSNPEQFYLLRVLDFEGGLRFVGTIENTDKIEKGSGVIAEYLLTKDEFDLWDTDEQAFRNIVETLCKTAPSDRFLKLYYQLTPQSPPVALKPILGEAMGTVPNPVEEMKNLFQFERNSDIARFKDFINGKGTEDVYFIYSNRIRNIYPAIDFDGKMFFVEGEMQAKALTEATKAFGNQYRKVSGEQAKEILENCKRYGVYKILFIKTDGEALVLDRDELLDNPTDNKWDTYNADIYNLLIRCIECSGIPNPQVKANQMTLTSQLSQRIFKTTFIVAVAQSSQKAKDTVWLSSGAENLRNQNKFIFSGAEHFDYVNAPEEKFIIRTLVNTKDNTFALPIFTDVTEFNTILGEESDIPLAVTLEEISTMKTKEVSTILLNPGTLGFILSEEALKELTEMSKQPPMVFEPQKTEEPEITIGDAEDNSTEKETTLNIPIIPQPSSTESILNMVANQINREDAIKKEHHITSEKQEEKEEKENFPSLREIPLEDDNTTEDTTEQDSTTQETEEDTATENQTTDSDNNSSEHKNEKKGGFFGLFRKKK